ncbi:hypothetical protein [Serratia liquefaciens]|uniref:hypothetical protein n=1 Tax=Serratia liquefaciens TaxID=614 RepID=UPI000AC1E8FD|nr:hypothetical protein [Serratia liquefaciens]
MTQTLTTDELRQIVDSHEKGYGMSVPINYGYLAARELLANREAQPVAHADPQAFRNFINGTATKEWMWKKRAPGLIPLYTTQPAPAVPDAISTRQAIANMERHELRGSINVAYKHGWNDFRAAMLAQPVSQGYKLVPVEPTEEMIAAAMNCDDVEFNSDETFCVNFDNIYRAMLAAAPEGGN